MTRTLNQYQKPIVTAAALIALALTSACGPKHDPKTDAVAASGKTLNINAIKNDPTLSPVDRAERLAEAAEFLVTPSSFMYAYDVAQTALSIDAKNRKARFVSALLAPTMEYQGIYTRIEPLVKKRPYEYAQFVKSKEDLRRMISEPAVARFLFDGPEDIASERDLQELIARYTARLDQLRQTLKELKAEGDLILTINEEGFKKQSVKDALQTCPIHPTSPGVFDTSACDLSHAYQRTMNTADFEAAQQIVAGWQVYYTLMNGWDLSGVYTKGDSFGQDSKKNFDLLLKNPAFGRLRSENGFGVIPDLARDALVGMRYAIQMQSQLCPHGESEKGSRPGHVFEHGICVKATGELDRALAKIELMLQGPTQVIFGEGGPHPIAVVVDPFAMVKKPVADVRTLMPFESNRCGALTRIGDPTAGGVFPFADFNDVLTETAVPCETNQWTARN